jgi:rRNA maturation endonuclease Nob1
MATEAQHILMFNLWRCEGCQRLFAPNFTHCPYCIGDGKVSSL